MRFNYILSIITCLILLPAALTAQDVSETRGNLTGSVQAAGTAQESDGVCPAPRQLRCSALERQAALRFHGAALERDAGVAAAALAAGAFPTAPSAALNARTSLVSRS